jgi:hypothetical protein
MNCIACGRMKLLQLVFWKVLLLLLGPFMAAVGKLYIGMRTSSSSNIPVSSDEGEQTTHRMIRKIMNPVDAILEHYFGQEWQCLLDEVFSGFRLVTPLTLLLPFPSAIMWEHNVDYLSMQYASNSNIVF